MNNQEQAMAEWLAHPMEFGELPAEINEIHRETTSWPLQEGNIILAFHRYKMKDGYTGIGMTGPITWSFLAIDLSVFSIAELKLLYAGWYIAFAAVNSDNFSREQNEKAKATLAEKLATEEAGFLNVIEYIAIGNLVFYAYEVQREQGKVTIAKDRFYEKIEYEEDDKYLQLPALYHFLGELFFRGYL